MPLYIVSDHAGFNLKNDLKNILNDLDLIDLSPNFDEGDDYPLKAKILANKIQAGDLGIAICGSGQGICMALNRHKHIRAAVLQSLKNAKLVRQHNHANIICLAGRDIQANKAANLVRTFLKTKPDNSDRHVRRVKEIDNL